MSQSSSVRTGQPTSTWAAPQQSWESLVRDKCGLGCDPSPQNPHPARRSPLPPFPMPFSALIPCPGHPCQMDLLPNFSVCTRSRGEAARLLGPASQQGDQRRKEALPPSLSWLSPTTVPTICDGPRPLVYPSPVSTSNSCSAFAWGAVSEQITEKMVKSSPVSWYLLIEKEDDEG